MRGLNGRVALVTGGTGLIGSAIVRRLVAEGATVVVGSRNIKKAQSWIEQQTLDRSKLIPLEIELGDATQIVSSLEKLYDSAAPPSVLIANASLRNGLSTPFDELSRGNFNSLFDIDVTGHFLCARHIIQRLSPDITGSIVFLSSIYSTNGVDHSIYDNEMLPTPPQYAAVKAAEIGLTRYLAALWGVRGVRVNAVVAGGVRSASRQNESFLKNFNRKTMLGRMASPEEIASAVVFLASDDASYITGEALVVDGGLSAW